MTILVVDDEPTITETVEIKLKREGYSVFTAASAEEGLAIARKVKPDLMVLDIMLPLRSGTDLAKTIRKERNVPIIFLTAKSAESDRVEGLDIADDYMVKPFSLAELAARIKSVLRRANVNPTVDSISAGNLTIDPLTHEALLGTEPLKLSPKEFSLLYFLALHPGQVFSRVTIIDRIWGEDAYITERTVDVHVRWLREKIEPDPAHPQRIVTVRGVGYKFAQ